jgi:probable phosphoglycerate mutase
MRLLLVRHGQSEWNAGRVLQGQADVPLSDLGRAQARALAPVIADLRPSHVLTSDLARATETAALLGFPDARREPRLREIAVGEWQGRSIPELIQADGARYAGWRAGTYRPQGGEDWSGFVARVGAALDEAMATHPVPTLLAVCHGGVIRAALQRFLALNPRQILPVGPASLTAIRFGRTADPARLELYNYHPGHPDLGAPD